MFKYEEMLLLWFYIWSNVGVSSSLYHVLSLGRFESRNVFLHTNEPILGPNRSAFDRYIW